MEHIRSTLATTAAAVLGLVVAAHVLHPGNFEKQFRPVRTAVVEAEAAPTTTWTDSPAALHPGVLTDPAVLSPRMAITPPPGVTMAAVLPAEMTSATKPPQRTAAARITRQRKVVQRKLRVRQVALARDTAGPVSPRQEMQLSAQKAKDGPLDGLLRGLGLKRDG